MALVRRTISPHAATLRREATDAEQLLWRAFRARQLGGHKFRRQWTIGRYIADFCCLESRLIIEVDGGQHTPDADRARTRALQAKGFRILRFWNNDVLGNLEGVLQPILNALEAKEEDPHPTLSRRRERALTDSRRPAAPSPACGRRLG